MRAGELKASSLTCPPRRDVHRMLYQRRGTEVKRKVVARGVKTGFHPADDLNWLDFFPGARAVAHSSPEGGAGHRRLGLLRRVGPTRSHRRFGDVVDVEHMITGARLLRTLGVPEDAIRPDMEEMDEKVKQEGPHLLVGPVAVRGAEAGDVLEVRIVEMGVVDPWAVNLFAPGGGALPKLFPYQGSKFVRLDLERKVALFAPGIEIPLRPFFGSIGVAPPPLYGPHRKRSSRRAHGEPRQQRARRRLDALHSGTRSKTPCCSIGDGTRGAG